MPGRTVVVALSASVSGFTEGMRQAGASALSFGRAAQASGQLADAASAKSAAAAAKVAAAQKRAADAAGVKRIADARLADAESRLAKLQNETAAGSARQVAAAEKVAKARRNQESAAEKLAVAESRLSALSAKPSFLEKVASKQDALDKTARTLTIIGGAAALGFGAAVREAARFDAGMARVAATGDDARQNIDKLRESALTAGRDIGVSGTQGTEGMEALLKAGVSAADVYGGGLKGALNLAAAGQLDVGQASEIAASAMTQFGLKGKDVPHIADLLAAAAGKAQGEVSDMGDALNYVGPVAAQMGISIEQTSGAIAELASNGIVGQKAGTGLRGILTSLSSPSKQASDKMKELGINVYDAQGNFVGFNGVAEQLRTKLGKLTNAQRDQALGQIFGNEQITAARILYQGGAAAVDQWTAAVDDNGFAARSAQTKLDSLQGSLTKLKAAFQTALIGAGDTKTGGLKSLVDSVTSVVDTFNELPDSAKGAVLTITGLVAAGALGAAGLIKVVTAAASARQALIDLGIAQKVANVSNSTFVTGLSRATGGIKGLAKEVGLASAALGAAYAAAAIGAQVFTDRTGPLVSSAAAAQNAILGLSKSSAGLTGLGRANDFFKNAKGEGVVSAHLFAREVDSLSGAFDRLFNATGYEKFTDKIDKTFGGLVGYTGDVDKLKQSFTSIDDALAQSDPTVAAAGFTKIANSAASAQVPVDQLVALFPQYKAELDKQATALGVTGLSARDYANWMQGIVPPTIQAAQAASGMGTAALEQKKNVDAVRDSLQALANPTQRTAEQSSQLAQSLFSEGDAFQSSVSAHAQYEASLDAANKQLSKGKDYTNKSKTALLDNSEAARQNLQALNDLSSSGKAYVQSLVLQGAGQDRVSKATQQVRDQFVKAAEAAGLNGKAANKLADDYGLIPDEVSTRVQVFGLAVQATEIENFKTALANLPKEQQAKIISIYNSKGAKAAESELNRLNGKVSKPKVQTQSNAQQVSARAQAFMRAVKDVDPKIKTGSNTASVTAAAKRFLASIKDKPVTVRTRAETAAAAAAKQLINSISSKTVTITTRRVTRQEVVKVGGTGGGVPTSATGGLIRGPGTAISDSIDAKLSDGEFVLRAAAVRAIGVAELHRLNSMGGPQRAFAAGGEVRRFASGGLVETATSSATLLRLVAALVNPIGYIANAAKAVIAGQRALRVAQLAARAPAADLKAAQAVEAQAKKKQAQLRTENAEDVRREKARIARLEKSAKATKGTTKADRDLAKERAKLKKLNDDYSLSSRKASDLVTKTADARQKAQDKASAADQRAKDAADRLKEAQAELAQQQAAVADSARQISDSFSSQYLSKTDDLKDFISLMNQGAAEVAAFNAKIVKLRKIGVSENVVQQIINMGQAQGGSLASQIIAGGKGSVSALNSASQKLLQAADKLGLAAATGVVRKATGGFLSGPGTGTSDSINLKASNGEYVVNAAATAANRAWLDAINYGRPAPVDHRFARYAGGGIVQHIDRTALVDAVRAAGVTLNINRMEGSPERVARELNTRLRDQLTLSGITASPVSA